jgi:nucleotide-binding universal stress UspA family protein
VKVLCAIDGSRNSQWALEWIPRVCSPDDSSLLLVQAIDSTPFKRLPMLDQKTRSLVVKMLELSLESASSLLEAAELKAAETWSEFSAKLLRGSPAEAIARTAKQEKAELVVMGSRGVTEFQPMLLGSVSRQVLMQAPCPVFLAKKPSRPLRRIILGADGSIESWAALSLLKQVPAEHRPAVTVVTVIPPLPLETLSVPSRALARGAQVRGVLRREAQKLATRMAATLRQARFSAEGTVLAGSPGAELVKFASCERADLIVVGSRSGRSVREYFLGSVADTVAKYAPCSVLVYRQ